jgi:hypothetical protein
MLPENNVSTVRAGQGYIETRPLSPAYGRCGVDDRVKRWTFFVHGLLPTVVIRSACSLPWQIVHLAVRGGCSYYYYTSHHLSFQVRSWTLILQALLTRVPPCFRYLFPRGESLEDATKLDCSAYRVPCPPSPDSRLSPATPS